MKIISISLVLFCATAAFAADKITPLDVKPGLWQTTVTVANKGSMPLPPEMLARMTPEQRARFDARMKALASPQTHVNKSCLTKEKLAKEQNPFGDDRNCTRKVVASTSSKMELNLECSMSGGIKSHGTLLIEVSNPENTRGSMHMVSTDGNRTMNMNSDFTAKWLSSSCGDVK